MGDERASYSGKVYTLADLVKYILLDGHQKVYTSLGLNSVLL